MGWWEAEECDVWKSLLTLFWGGIVLTYQSWEPQVKITKPTPIPRAEPEGAACRVPLDSFPKGFLENHPHPSTSKC